LPRHPQSSLPNLRDLDLFNCPVTEVDSYRQGLFEMLPNLKYLDGFDA
jgi:acidic leucine-rich nuclear phosphoprotein 32 family protein A/C/D